MFRCPQGHNEEARKGKHGAAAMLTAESVWSVEIFGANFRSSDDLANDLSRDLSMAQRGAAMGMVGGMSASASDCFLDEDLHIHVTTFLPSLQNPQKWEPVTAETPGPDDYESCLIAMVRCRRWLQSFHKKGHKLTVLSLQSVMLPGSHAGPAAVVRHGPQALYKGVYSPEVENAKAGSSGSAISVGGAGTAGAGGAASVAAAAVCPALPLTSLVQGVRVWFSFDQEKTIHVRKRGGHLGLQVWYSGYNQCTYSIAVINQRAYRIAVINQCAYSMHYSTLFPHPPPTPPPTSFPPPLQPVRQEEGWIMVSVMRLIYTL
jgi:hypothetical protein